MTTSVLSEQSVLDGLAGSNASSERSRAIGLDPSMSILDPAVGNAVANRRALGLDCAARLRSSMEHRAVTSTTTNVGYIA